MRVLSVLASLACACGGAEQPAPELESTSETVPEVASEAEPEAESEEAEPEAEVAVLDVFERQCAGGDADMCREAAGRHPDRAEPLLQRARELQLVACDHCREGEADDCDPIACLNLADAFAHGRQGAPIDAEQSERFYDRAIPLLRSRCRRAADDYLKGRACLAWAHAALGGHGGQRGDYDRIARRAGRPLRRACAAGSALACATWGSMHWDGEGVDRNEARAVEIWARAQTLAVEQCAAGDAEVCAYIERRRAAQQP